MKISRKIQLILQKITSMLELVPYKTLDGLKVYDIKKKYILNN